MEASSVLIADGRSELLFGELCKTSVRSEPIFGTKCRVITYLNIRRYQSEIQILYSRCERFEEAMKHVRWKDDIIRDIRDSMGYSDMLDLYDIRRSEDGTVDIERNQEAINHMELSSGKTIIMTNSDLSLTDEAEIEILHSWFDMEMYILRESLPYISNMFKSYPEAESLMSVEFLSFAIRLEIHRKLKEKGRFDLTVQDIIDRLKGIYAIKVKNRWHLGELTESQREALFIIGIDLPSDSELGVMMSMSAMSIRHRLRGLRFRCFTAYLPRLGGMSFIIQIIRRLTASASYTPSPHPLTMSYTVVPLIRPLAMSESLASSLLGASIAFRMYSRISFAESASLNPPATNTFSSGMSGRPSRSVHPSFRTMSCDFCSRASNPPMAGPTSPISGLSAM